MEIVTEQERFDSQYERSDTQQEGSDTQQEESLKGNFMSLLNLYNTVQLNKKYSNPLSRQRLQGELYDVLIKSGKGDWIGCKTAMINNTLLLEIQPPSDPNGPANACFYTCAFKEGEYGETYYDFMQLPENPCIDALVKDSRSGFEFVVEKKE